VGVGAVGVGAVGVGAVGVGAVGTDGDDVQRLTSFEFPRGPHPDPSRPHPFGHVWELGRYVPVAPLEEFPPGRTPFSDKSFMVVGLFARRLYIPGNLDCKSAGVLASHSTEMSSALASEKKQGNIKSA
jgi:hypothetical protein